MGTPPALAAAVVATSSWTALWAVSGLETLLFTFALVAAVVAYQAERRTTAAGLMLLLALTRVEGIFFGLAFAIVLLRERGFCREVKRPLLVLFVPFVTILLLITAYYGHLLPNSYRDKSGLSLHDAVHAGTHYLIASVRAAFGLPRGDALVDPLVSLIPVVLSVIALALVWGLGWVMTALLSRWPVGVTSTRTLFMWCCIVAAVVALVIVGRGQKDNVVASISRYQPPGTPDLPQNPHYLAMARCLQEQARPGDLVGIEEAGLIPYGTPGLRYLDLFGLTDATIAAAPGVPPFDKHDNRYVLASRPRYLVIWGVPDGHGGFRWSHQQSLVRDRHFIAEYQPVHSAPKDNHYAFLVYKRRG